MAVICMAAVGALRRPRNLVFRRVGM